MFDKVRRYFKYIFIPVPKPEKWVFIVGTTNSGTTLLHDILSLHPHIGSMPKEGQFLTDQLPIPKHNDAARLWTQRKDLFYLDEQTPNSINVKRMLKQWAMNYNDYRRPVLLEKTPVNALRVRWLQKEISNAYFIGVYRNGYAVAQGIRAKTGCSITEAASHWALNNELMFNDFEKLRNKFFVKYEDLVTKPHEVVKDIFLFLNLQPLSEFEINRKYSIHKVDSPIMNMNDRALSNLTEEDVLEITRAAGPLLKHLNYYPYRA